MSLEQLTIDAFSDKVGHVFVIEEPDHPAIELTLIEASPLRNYAKLKREPFSLFFTSQSSGVLPNGCTRCGTRCWACTRSFLCRSPATMRM